jgi:uncharacterized protein YdaU (DUF1376 family)
MNYYPFHMGDYALHTGHLEPLEDLAYRRILDLYYAREGPLPCNPMDVARLVRMRSNVVDVETVLREFFTLTDAGWTHSRCDQEIAKFRASSERAKANGKLGGRPKKAAEVSEDGQKTTQQAGSGNPEETQWVSVANPDLTQTKANQNHNQNHNQEPKEKDREANAADAAKPPRGRSIPDGFPGPEEIAWCASERPELQADSLSAVFRDYHLAHGSTMKSWSAAWRTWVRKERAQTARASPNPPYQTALDKQREVIDRLTGRSKSAPNDPMTFDMELARAAIPRN